MKIKVGIVGWGNLGKGVRLAIQQNPDMELVSVFTRRDPSLVGAGEEGVHFLNIDKAKQFTDRIDVMVPQTTYSSRAHILPAFSTPSIVLIPMLKYLNIMPLWIKKPGPTAKLPPYPSDGILDCFL